MDLNRLCDEVLSLVEFEETRLLSWGFLEVGVDLDRQIETFLGKLAPHYREIWEQLGHPPEAVTENLLNRQLIFKNSRGLYFSRYAETIRLLLLLRQRFDEDDWMSAPRLVSDARIQLQRRRYPKRDLPQEQVLQALQGRNLSKLQTEVLQVLMEGPQGQKYAISGFQKRSIESILQRLEKKTPSAVVIGAGTGSGKTKAFYIPALTWLAEHMSSERYIAILAVYPRNELLKDQFTEALRETERLNQLLHKQGKRPIRIGTYYGGTPPHASENRYFFKEHGDWEASFTRCPRCDQPLFWKLSERQNKREVLECRKADCGYRSHPDHLAITRDTQSRQVPDIIFTTTEMLNKHMGDAVEGHLLGIGANRLPALILLDEIHTYEGISGANVAHLLRRWRKVCGYGRNQTLCIVGLSATLAQPREFFSQLIGLPVVAVDAVQPTEEEMEEEGMEYNLALKGDSSTGTSLLSTSIQTAMLLARTLDPLTGQHEGVFAPKVFAFCNRLDTLNRWHDDQKDAEKKVLSKYRATSLDAREELLEAQHRAGQLWRMSERLGYDLKRSIKVARTSSQDKGVDPDAKLVLASPSLEVGFNDKQVGAVIQHQSPYGVASFLQRKGRAGRQRHTRPWTVVVMSDYGRDRWHFQNSEFLFNPTLPLINLPIDNYYVQKIAASYILLDWLFQRLRKEVSKLKLWDKLKKDGRVRAKALHLLSELLHNSQARRDYEQYLRDTMNLVGDDHDTTVRSLLWGEPRPILTEVVPTLIREFETEWTALTFTDQKALQSGESVIPTHPLPQFVPSTLFSDLNLPEIEIKLIGKNTKPELGQFVQTFEEILPGKVSKRFREDDAPGRWLAIPIDLPGDRIAINQLKLDYDPMLLTLNANGQEYFLKRPIRYKLDRKPGSLSEFSTSFAIWRSSFRPLSSYGGALDPLELALPMNSAWGGMIDKITAYTQTRGQSVQVIRGMVGLQINWSVRGERIYRTLDFVEEIEGQTRPSGIGYALDVDALCVAFRPLDVVKLKASPLWSKILRSARPHFYLHRLQNDPIIRARNLTIFEIERLWQVIYSALIAVAISRKVSLVEACEYLSSHFLQACKRVLKVIFQGQGQDEDTTGRQFDRTLDLLGEPELKDTLISQAEVLWSHEPEGLDEWLRQQYASSLASVFFTVASALIADVAATDLNLDVEYDQSRFWISETIPGGVGMIARIVEQIARYPRHLEMKLNDIIQHCDRAHLSGELSAVVRLLKEGTSSLAASLADIRSRYDVVSLGQAKEGLLEALEQGGIATSRAVVVAINAKILRPNSDQDSDDLIHDLLERWQSAEDRLGCALDLRTFAVAIHSDDLIKEQLSSLLRRIQPQDHLTDNQRYNLLQSMLWIGCNDACEDCIKYRGRYQTLIHPSRILLQALQNDEKRTVYYGDEGWQDELHQALAECYEAHLICPQAQIERAKPDLMRLMVIPVEVGFQHFFPVLERLDRHNDDWVIQIVLPEMAQG
jgi:hypothetical protein